MLEILQTILTEPKAFPSNAKDALRSLVEILRQLDSIFLKVALGPIEPDPLTNVDITLNTFYLPIANPCLGIDAFHGSIPGMPVFPYGSASISVFSDGSEVAISQPVKEKFSAHVDEVALGQAVFASKLYSALLPAYGWIDEIADLEPSAYFKDGLPRRLFWANFFGPEIVKKMGKEFLLVAPGWKKELLEDGGILYVVTPNFSDWHKKASAEALEYFRTKIPFINPFRSRGGHLPDEVLRMVQIDDATGEEAVVYDRDRKSTKKPKARKKKKP